MEPTQAGGDELLGQVVDEYFDAVARGETPDLADYMRRYPEIADVLKVAIPVMRATDDAARPATECPDRSPPSKQLGDFRLLRQLGRGGMGIVYEAEQISVGRRVALKVLPLAGLVDELKIRRFRNEVRAVAALDHPNIVSVYTIGDERGVHYYAMQLIRGSNLATVISSLRAVRDQGETPDGQSVSQIARSGNALDTPELDATKALEGYPDTQQRNVPAETVGQADDTTIPSKTRHEYFRSVASLGIQAANALTHAHDQGVVHRDIKPANLLLDSTPRLYITDFGLARIEADASVTMTGDLLGTLRYMAPEQALAKRVVVDHRADIYSLGVTLYELLTLQPAYSAEDRQQLLKQIAFEEPKPLRRVDAAIPADLEVIVQKAMSKDMEDRYPSAQELADDLQSFLEHRPIMAKPPALLQVAGKWTRRNPTVVAASLVTLTFIVVALAVSTMLVLKQRDVAENQAQISTITRLAAESRNLHDESPYLGMLLAAESVELSRSIFGTVMPVAHESLLNATQRLLNGRVLSGHNTTLSQLAMSSDWLVGLGTDQKVYLWDLTAKKPWTSPRILGEEDGIVRSIRWSRDGRWLLTAGTKLQRWDLQARHPDSSPLVLPTGTRRIATSSLSSNGRWLATQTEDGTLRIWDFEDAAPETPWILPKPSWVFGQIAVTSTGRWLIAKKEGEILLYDLAARTPPRKVQLDNSGTWKSIAVSPDGLWLAIVMPERNLVLCDLRREKPTSSIQRISVNDHRRVAHLRFTLDSRWMFATAQARIYRWDLSAPDIAASRSEIRGHKDAVSALLTSDVRPELISGSQDGTVRFWPLHGSDSQIPSLDVRAHDSVRAVAIDPRGRWFATAGADGTARLWDRQATGTDLSPFVLKGEPDDIHSDVTISSDGRWIAAEVEENSVRLWDLEADRPEFFSRLLKRKHNAEIVSIGIIKNDQWLVAVSKDSTVQLWDLTKPDVASSSIALGKPAPVSVTPESNMDQLAMDPTERWLAVPGADHTVHLWDLSSVHASASLKVLRGHRSLIRSLAISPDGRWLVSAASEDSDLRVWDVEADDIQASSRELTGQKWRFFSLSFDPDSQWVVAASGAPSPWLYALQTDHRDTPPRVLPPAGSHRPDLGIWRTILSADARWLFTACFDNTAQLWDLTTDPPTRHELLGHNGVQSAAISPDGHWLVTVARRRSDGSPGKRRGLRARRGGRGPRDESCRAAVLPIRHRRADR